MVRWEYCSQELRRKNSKEHTEKTDCLTDSLCLSQTVYVCHRQSLPVTGSLCLSDTLFLIILDLVLLIYMWFSPSFAHEILIFPAFKHHQHQLCWMVISKLLQGVTWVIEGFYSDVVALLEGCYKDDTGVFKGCFISMNRVVLYVTGVL